MQTSRIPVSEFMTKAPHGISPTETLGHAQARMHELKVRHLVVRDGGRIVGMLSERDLELVMAVGESSFAGRAVELAMTPDPYVVPPTATVQEVAREMADRRIGSAVVVDGKKNVVGIFTATDALRMLSK